jgi:hypothetical protein
MLSRSSIVLTIDLARSAKIKYPVTGACRALHRANGAVSLVFVAVELGIGWRENIHTS